MVTGRKVNDAFIVTWAGNLTLQRAIALTEDNRAVVRPCSKILKVEDKPGEWSKIGYFLPQSCHWYMLLFGAPRTKWVFHPLRNTNGSQ